MRDERARESHKRPAPARGGGGQEERVYLAVTCFLSEAGQSIATQTCYAAGWRAPEGVDRILDQPKSVFRVNPTPRHPPTMFETAPQG